VADVPQSAVLALVGAQTGLALVAHPDGLPLGSTAGHVRDFPGLALARGTGRLIGSRPLVHAPTFSQ